MSLSTWSIVGCGYTGTALARRLIAEGHQIVVTRRDPTAARELATELGAEGIALDLAAITIQALPDSIVVCLAPPGADPAAEAANLARFAEPARRLIYVSSTGVYAHGGGAWVDESWPLEPTTTSGEHRLAFERALPARAVILRAAGIHGPGRGIEDRLRTGTYRIVGDGRAHVSRIHVDDLVEAIVLRRAGKGEWPGVDIIQILASKDPGDAIREIDGFTRAHGRKGENVQRPTSNVQR